MGYLENHKFRPAEDYVNLNPRSIIKADDCIIQAIMYSRNMKSSLDWVDIYKEMAWIGLNNFIASNHTVVCFKYLSRHGYEIHNIGKENKIPTATFLDDHTEGNYVVIVNRHAFAYIDGKIYDKFNYIQNPDLDLDELTRQYVEEKYPYVIHYAKLPE